jgi:hypothetical protein
MDGHKAKLARGKLVDQDEVSLRRNRSDAATPVCVLRGSQCTSGRDRLNTFT